MNEYFTIEKEKDLNLVANEIEPEKEKKYYSIHIEGLPCGNLKRETEVYSEALDIYRAIKESFYLYECKVILQKHIIIEGKETTTIIHVKQIGVDFGIKKHLQNILDSLDQLDKMKKLYTSTNSECDKYISAFNHSLETINAERLTEEQMRNLFRNIEEKGAIRRISKSQLDYLLNLQNNLGSIRANTNKALETFKKMEYNRNTQKAIENRTAKDKEYLTTIGLL